MIKKILGVLIFLLGITILGWIGFNFLIEMQPSAQGRSPIIPILFSLAAIYVGIKWTFTKNQ